MLHDNQIGWLQRQLEKRGTEMPTWKMWIPGDCHRFFPFSTLKNIVHIEFCQISHGNVSNIPQNVPKLVKDSQFESPWYNWMVCNLIEKHWPVFFFFFLLVCSLFSWNNVCKILSFHSGVFQRSFVVQGTKESFCFTKQWHLVSLLIFNFLALQVASWFGFY